MPESDHAVVVPLFGFKCIHAFTIKVALKVYCEYASEMNWRSLGFAGYKETIDKLTKDNGIVLRQPVQAKPAMAPILYTLH